MSIGKSIRKHFEDRAQYRKEVKAFNANIRSLVTAIHKGDDEAFSVVFENVKRSPLLEQAIVEDLLKEALIKDNETAFSAILATRRDPNVYFATVSAGMSSYGAGPVIISNEHVLDLAISSGSKNVALALAKNEKVSLDRTGYTEVIYGFSKNPKATPFGSTFLGLAQKKGMTEVAKALEERACVSAAAVTAKSQAASVPKA